MREFRHLTVGEPADGIVHIQLNRPPANAVDRDMYIELADAFGDIDRLSANARVAILSGVGKHFCAGNDLDEFATMTPENGTERMWRVREAFYAISGCSVPVIGAIHGAALGTGLALAASCDFVVASRESSFGLPELTVGVMGGARHLARMAPQPLVRRMYFTGQPLPAAEFEAAGAAIIVCEPEDLLDRATAFATRIAGYSPTAVRVSKRILDRIEFMDLTSGYAFEQAGTVRMSGHPDSKEALAAFREKREPGYAPLDRDAHWFGA
ncbi:enoyl-CoA hydratase-related protein [Sphingomonas sp. G-3-2-10]|uniref:enoyl-CoA hydratase-related protein n=1 Tax=Sphingomonas sp. G-3-2-10 TaxID=2728838 RepID=UPI00146A5F8E|nr:enoyl-CoA hydratase-related protein [Sphingomonas sp. G-3-2-10]NML05855.1 crotonase [Sphingomonas sp. G-3-2-10]